MKNIMFELTPGTDSKTQQLIARQRELAARLDAAHKEIADYHKGYQQQHERKLEQVREVQS